MAGNRIDGGGGLFLSLFAMFTKSIYVSSKKIKIKITMHDTNSYVISSIVLLVTNIIYTYLFLLKISSF